ncbi:hypothetical protein Fmac_029077 [Flemingia macrophylla]|uniref:Transmembrane protein n=1 Tax=Flemingia macrophylla TaxID=520843 RepID=A0ABD1L9N2_9FABA
MESNQTISKEKLGFLGILKEAVKIPCKNPNFIILTCLTSLPLLYSLFLYETLFMQTLTEAAKVLHKEGAESLVAVDRLIGEVSHNILLLILWHMGIIQLCDFFSTIVTVNSASIIHAGDHTLTLKEMFTKHFMESRLKGPLITSFYTLLLTSIVSVGLLSLLVYIYVLVNVRFMLMTFFMAMFVALSRLYLEWGAVWEMGTVISILEDKEGDVALVVAAYFSRGNRGTGILLMACCHVWRLGLRIVCLFIAVDVVGGSKILILVVQVCLVGLANIVKWVCFVVYYVDCRKKRLEKDAGGGQEVSSV